jgi:hypothetical protein
MPGANNELNYRNCPSTHSTPPQNSLACMQREDTYGRDGREKQGVQVIKDRNLRG